MTHPGSLLPNSITLLAKEVQQKDQEKQSSMYQYVFRLVKQKGGNIKLEEQNRGLKALREALYFTATLNPLSQVSQQGDWHVKGVSKPISKKPRSKLSISTALEYAL